MIIGWQTKNLNHCSPTYSPLNKISCWRASKAGRRRSFGDKIELLFFDFERADRRQTLELGVTKTTFRLGCTPVVNLFEQVAEPILMEQKRFEYRIVPDARREEALDIFAVDLQAWINPANLSATAYW